MAAQSEMDEWRGNVGRGCPGQGPSSARERGELHSLPCCLRTGSFLLLPFYFILSLYHYRFRPSCQTDFPTFILHGNISDIFFWILGSCKGSWLMGEVLHVNTAGYSVDVLHGPGYDSSLQVPHMLTLLGRHLSRKINCNCALPSPSWISRLWF